jgi:superfamily II DNA or RNA helicase
MDRLRIGDLYAEAPDYDPDNAAGLRTCGANLVYLHDRFADAIWHDPGNRLMEARAYRYVQRLHNAEPGEYERTFPFKVAPHPYQLKLFTHARHLDNMALAPCALGTGKSKMILDIAADKFLRDKIDGLCIIAPNGVHRQWIEQAIPEHLSDHAPCTTHIWRPRVRIPNDVMHEGESYRRLRVMAFNVEAFSSDTSPSTADIIAFMRSGRIMLVMDESTRIKNYKAQRTKRILRLAPLAACRAILSGTPITRGLEDIFTQYQFLDENIIGLRNYFAFRNHYCITRPVRGRAAALGAVEIVGYRNQEELVRKIAPVSFMVPSSALDLPPQRFERIEVQMTPEQARIYTMLAKQLVEDLAARRIESPAIALTRILRLQQVLCGRYYKTVTDEEGMETTEPHRVANNRPEALANALEAHDGQALIWCRFKADVKDIIEAIDNTKRIGVIEGGVPLAERAEKIAAFRRGELDYMILNIASGSTGLDGLQCCSASFYYSNTFNREHRWQSEGRIHRLGQLQSALYVDFVTPDSVDELILDAHAATADLARTLMASPHLLQGGRDGLTRHESHAHDAGGSRLEAHD